jgi:hypothetical protein
MNCMNRILSIPITMTLILLLSFNTQCQTANEWLKQKKTQKQYLIEQMAALQVYLKNLKQGYTVVNKGLNLVGEITGNSYSMDNIYIESLLQVKAPVANSELSSSIVVLERGIRTRLRILRQRIDHNTGLLTADESTYLKKVAQKAESILSEQIATKQKVQTTDKVQMTDAGRVQILRRVKADLEELESFLGQADGELTRLIIQRQEETHEIHQINRIHQ